MAKEFTSVMSPGECGKDAPIAGPAWEWVGGGVQGRILPAPPTPEADKESFDKIPPLPGRLTSRGDTQPLDAPPPGAWAFIESERP